MGIDEPCLEWVPYMPGATVKGYSVLSWNVPLGTGSYYMPVGLSIRPNKNRVSLLPKGIYPGDYGTPGRQGSRGASTPHRNTGWPPGRIQEVVVQYLYGHHKHGSYIATYQFPPSRCKLFNYYRLSSNNVHSVFTTI